MTESVIAAGWRALCRVLTDVTPDGLVQFAGFADGTFPDEYIVVVADTEYEHNTNLTYGGAQPGAAFDVTVAIATKVPGREPFEVLDRLEELASLVECTIDEFAGSGIRPAELVPFRAFWRREGRTTRSVVPVDQEGYGGFAEITVSVLMGRNPQTSTGE